ncbi:hypothetical protein [Caballeronia sp. INSB1]|uniref:hypothetical protein n=1 Tax=Caballeronia sp. INSB1 TaxID=2921751 RepID=UPI002032E7CA|nr:hypothetical protein [Caballeronia sp. INSB1]
MSVDVRNTKPTNGADAIEPKADLEAKAVPLHVSKSRVPAVQTWSWGKQHDPYDWMDAHTPCHDLSAWH